MPFLEVYFDSFKILQLKSSVMEMWMCIVISLLNLRAVLFSTNF